MSKGRSHVKHKRDPSRPSDKVAIGGVGSLPGTPNEADIARLPKERLHATEISSIDSHAPQRSLPSESEASSQGFSFPRAQSRSTNILVLLD
jgi:hypothetical protein